MPDLNDAPRAATAPETTTVPPVALPELPDPADPNFAMGGQAVLEGVMMRGPRSYAVAVRKPHGNIVMQSRSFIPVTKRRKWLGIPVVRGAVSLIEMLVLGYRTLEYSANIVEEGYREQEAREAETSETDAPAPQPDTLGEAGVAPLVAATAAVPTPDAEAGPKVPQPAPAPSQNKAIGGWQMAGIFALSMGLAMLLFVALPNYATMGIGKLMPSGELVEINSPLLYNLISGVVRLCVIVGYIWLISRMEDIGRLFQYHGAEHKVVMAYEQKIPLDIEHLRPVTTLHPRCGTTFIAIVALVSIFCFALLAGLIVILYPAFNEWSVWARKPVIIVTHILFMPLIGGMAFEITRRAGRRPNFWPYHLLLLPGYAFQHLTTREPDDSMLEVALAAFHEALQPKRVW